MTIASKFFPTAVLCASLLAAGVAAAQDPSPSRNDEANADSYWPAKHAGSHGASDQARLLEEALERYRDIERHGGWKLLPSGPAMGPEYSYDCSRIAPVEKRLVAEGYLRRVRTPPPPPVPTDQTSSRRSEPPRPEPPPRCEYGAALTDAVKAFQADRKVLGYGQVGKLTVAELNKPVEEIIRVLEHDLMRWREVSLEPSGTYLLVNIPFYELIAYENGREAMRMPVIVGQPTWQTPTFRAEVQYLILNPDWGIPDKIAKAEYLPFAKRDSKYLSRQGIADEGGSLRQKPGPNNPLGRVKFVMPNSHDVYLHDTPAKGAFNAAVKALSHGCIRLSHPMDLANYLLRDDSRWNPHRLETAVASKQTQQVDLQHHIPVHIIYSTSRVNDDGRLELRPDVYGLDKAPSEERRHGPSDESIDAWP